jgi:hypothetical protein
VYQPPFPIFIGHDPKEAVAFHVCCESIIRHSTIPVSFTPVSGAMRDGSNTFIYARFLVPYLCGYKGQALFLDGDMLVRGNIAELVNQNVPRTGVSVVKHDYKTKFVTKYLGNKNEDYPRKNWSSVVLWDCGFYPNRVLTPDFIAKQPGSFLHRFAWLADEQIGALPPTWNRLVLEDEPDPTAKLYHYTIGTPCFGGAYGEGPEAREWFDALNDTMQPLTP